MPNKKYVVRCWKVKASSARAPRSDGRKGFFDAVDIQISVTAKIPRGKNISRQVIEEAIKYKCATGRDPHGFKIKITRWRNPDRSEGDVNEVYRHPDDAERQAGWRVYGPQKERFATLGRALRGSRMVYKITSYRCTGRNLDRFQIVHRRGRKGQGARKIPGVSRSTKARRIASKVAAVRPHKKRVARHHSAKRKARTR